MRQNIHCLTGAEADGRDQKFGILSILASGLAHVMGCLLSDRHGGAAIIFALSLIPILGVIGGAIDYGRALSMRTKMQSAGDAAALAAATAATEGMRGSDLDQFALDAFKANLGNDADASPRVQVTINDGSVQVATTTSVPTPILELIGVNKFDVGSISEVNIPKLLDGEIVLVLDYSSSMNRKGKYQAMRDAALELVKEVGRDGQAENVKFGLVPFALAVYPTMPSEFVVGQPSGDIWTNCTSDRLWPLNLEDSTPIISDDGTKWISDAPADNGGHGSAPCHNYPNRDLVVLPLTDDMDAVSAQLRAMTPYAGTNISVGLEMGWHVISPNAPYTEGVEYNDDKVMKTIVLLTDGRQTAAARGPGGQRTSAQGEENLEVLCESIKSQGVQIITVAFDLNSASTKERLEKCASSSAHFFDADTNSDLVSAFSEIAGKLAGELRLTR